MLEHDSLQQGEVLNGRYEVYEVIGNGGFGIIYRAFDFLLNRFVAVKEFYIVKWMGRGENGRECVSAALEAAEQEKAEACRVSFLREAGIMEKLRNIPYLSRIQDRFTENNTEYIVMKLFAGESLADWVKKHGRLSHAKLFPMAEQVLYALEQMHERGFIHRDICPGNLMQMEDGDLYLIDFGSATSCDRNSELWNEQVFEHKGFEAPEHSVFAEQGPWTDIYSLCASLVWLLTGEAVPEAEEREKNDCLPRILMNAGLSAGQQNILLKGLSVDRRSRYLCAKDLRVALCGESAEAPEEWHVRYAAKTDIGSREVNQDNLTVDGFGCYEGVDIESSGQLTCNYDELHLAAVCDGVGGEHLGELASRAAIQALKHFVEQNGYSRKLPERLIDELLDQMNEKVISLGTKIGTAATTLSFLLWKGNHYWSINIGDSPIYLLRKGKLTRLSIPHTKAYASILFGKPVSPSDLHTLVNYLGKKKAAGSQMAAIRHGHLQKGDTFLICSDGVMDVLEDKHLRKCLRKGEQKGILSIWKMLGRKEDRDNCSAVIVQF